MFGYFQYTLAYIIQLYNIVKNTIYNVDFVFRFYMKYCGVFVCSSFVISPIFHMKDGIIYRDTMFVNSWNVEQENRVLGMWPKN